MASMLARSKPSVAKTAVAASRIASSLMRTRGSVAIGRRTLPVSKKGGPRGSGGRARSGRHAEARDRACVASDAELVHAGCHPAAVIVLEARAVGRDDEPAVPGARPV